MEIRNIEDKICDDIVRCQQWTTVTVITSQKLHILKSTWNLI